MLPIVTVTEHRTHIRHACIVLGDWNCDTLVDRDIGARLDPLGLVRLQRQSTDGVSGRVVSNHKRLASTGSIAFGCTSRNLHTRRRCIGPNVTWPTIHDLGDDTIGFLYPLAITLCRTDDALVARNLALVGRSI